MNTELHKFFNQLVTALLDRNQLQVAFAIRDVFDDLPKISDENISKLNLEISHLKNENERLNTILEGERLLRQDVINDNEKFKKKNGELINMLLIRQPTDPIKVLDEIMRLVKSVNKEDIEKYASRV